MPNHITSKGTIARKKHGLDSLSLACALGVRYTGIVLKYIFLILMSIFIGSLLTYSMCAFDKEYVIVKILDNDECSPKSYSIVMSNSVVKVLGDQIRTESPDIALGASAEIYFVPSYNGKDKHAYKIVAEYLDCETLISEEREAERGRLIYEWIKKRKFEHTVRA